MTKEEIFIWAQDKTEEYTVLAKLREEVINGTVFLCLPGERGIYKGVYLCLYENSTIYKLRSAGYVAAVAKDYEAVRDIILGCVQFTKKFRN